MNLYCKKHLWSVRLLALGLSLVLIFTVASCGRNNAPNPSGTVIQRDCAYFETKQIVPEYQTVGTCNYGLIDVCSKGDETVMLLNYRNAQDYEKGTVTDIVAVFLDAEGNQTKAFSLLPGQLDFSASAIAFMEDGRLAVLGLSISKGYMIRIISPSTDVGEETIILPSTNSYYVDLMEYKSQWVLLTYESFIVTDKNGEKILDAKLESSLIGDEMFDIDGKPSIWIDYTGTEGIAAMDVSSGEISENALGTLMGEDIGSFLEMSGGYLIDGQAVLKADFESSKLLEIAEWNSIDIVPSEYIFNITINHVLDDDTILRDVQPVYPEADDELIFMKHRDTDPNAGKKVLTIGGFNIADRDLIQYAAYLYNIGDYGYRIKLVEYWDKYSYVDMAGMSRAYADIITDMSEGNGDDMFCGAEFNFDVWGEAGMVVDMMDMAKKDPTFDLNALLPSMLELSMDKDKLYKLFPSFSFSGYVGYSDMFEVGLPLTIENAQTIGDNLSSDQKLLVNAERINLASSAIQYRLEDFCSEETGFSISEEALAQIVDFANDFGIANMEPDQMFSDPATAYVTGKLLLYDAFITSPYEYNRLEQVGSSTMTFYGIPSVYNSTQLCAPRNLIAISAGSDDVEACWEFVKLLFSDEAQRRAMEEDSIPVSVTMFEEQIAKAMDKKEMTAADELAASFSDAPKPMTEASAENYRKCVNSLNSINCYNVDLGIILREEFNSYYLEGKSLSDVRKSMISRVNLYLNEN